MNSIDRTSHINPFLAFLLWCSGAELSILKEVPIYKSKYIGIGGTVLITGLLASLSGGYALYITSGNVWLGFVGGVLWGVFILNLYRYIVSTMTYGTGLNDDTNHILQNLLPAIPRLILVICIGIVISKPIELALFKPENEKQIQIEQQRPLAELEDNIASKEAELSSLNGILQSETERLNELLNSYLMEVRGAEGTRLIGNGKVAKIKQERYEQAERDFRDTKARIEPRITEISATLAVLKNRREELLSQLQQRQTNSYLDRLKAQSDLAQKDNSMAWAGYMITLLMILVETSPVVVILLSPKGGYEELLEEKLEEENPLHTEKINSELQRAFIEALDNSALKPKK